jgi:hypothetical protein
MIAGVLVSASILLALSWTVAKRVFEYVFFFLGLSVMLVMWILSLVYDSIVEVWHDVKRGW